MNASNHAILWDMDGTIIDTAKIHFDTWAVILNRYGMELTNEIFLKFFGKNNHVFVLYFFPNADQAFIKKLSYEKEEAFCELATKEAPLYPGVEEWLAYFQAQGYRQAIASSAAMMNIDVLVDSTHIRKYFDYLGSGDNLPAKPAPDLFRHVAKQLGVTDSHCMVIEDSPAGVQGAVNAKMKSIAITNSQLASAINHADIVIDQFTKENLEVAEKHLLN
jgi:HAD superfamily hydrolase (TIGR01509 family)